MTEGRIAPLDPSLCPTGLSPDALLEDVDSHDEGVVGYVLSELKHITEMADSVHNQRQFADVFKQHLYRLQWVLHEHPMLRGHDYANVTRMRVEYDHALPDLVDWVGALACGQTYAAAHIRHVATQLYAAARPVMMSLRS